MTLQPENVGLGGVLRPGVWSPMVVTLQNQSSVIRQVRLQWVHPDADGDQVVNQRLIKALNPQRVERFWLYACLPVSSRMKDRYEIRLVDEETGKLLQSQRYELPEVAPQYGHVIGLVGFNPLGLNGYAHEYCQHEKALILQGLSPDAMPDRWYGLSLLHSLIWSPDGGDVSTLPRAAVPAIHEWVRRGGHLVVVLPNGLETWSKSELADLLPAVTMTTLTNQRLPMWLGRAQGLREPTISLRVLTPDTSRPESREVSTLLSTNEGFPVVVASPYGLGRVTLIGIDLTERAVVTSGLPNGNELWKAVYGWEAMWMPKAVAEQAVQSQQMNNPVSRAVHSLDAFIPSRIAKTETAAPALLLAIIIFALYWLIAGPISYAYLKSKGKLHYSWMAFLVVVAVFNVIAWGGAVLLRPRTAALQHVSILTHETGTGWTRTHSWLATFIPRFGRVPINITPPDGLGNFTTVTTSGVLDSDETNTFLDPQSYTVDTMNPADREVPMRATAKEFEIDYATRLVAGGDGLSKDWVPPQGTLRNDDGFPSGALVHGFPADLTDAFVVYSPGNGQSPWAWRIGTWAVGSALKFEGKLPSNAVRMLTPPPPNREAWGGFLGQLFYDRKPGWGTLMGFAGGQAMQQSPTTNASDQEIYAVEAMTFYDALPAPDTKPRDMQNFTDLPLTVIRSAGRIYDLTEQLALRRVLIIGHIRDGPLPVPLKVDDRTLPSRGWTVVRILVPVE